ncbi:MAG TPA: vanadium-dependent haloperoxidase [Methylomirabilota bacterium]|nr:vanadium-dependent haloperoxidase [Methylomirabilota bacterium]
MRASLVVIAVVFGLALVAEAGTDTAGALPWNALARDLVATGRLDPLEASRVYALLSVAQHLALGPAPASEQAAVATASAHVLGRLFPSHVTRAGEDRSASASLGERVARDVIERALSDGSDRAGDRAEPPVGAGGWRADRVAVKPRWGQVRPWLMSRGDQLRPPPPPASGSREFDEALGVVRRISHTRTPQQVSLAERWADGAGSATPPGHWNAIASELIERHDLDARRATFVLAILNMAMMDSGIAAWDAKYAYGLLRPWQADPTITTVVARPDFPSYVSGHSAFSGAAAVVLGHFFPTERETLARMAQDASDSRVHAGLHYDFDCEKGLALGRAVGRLALAHARSP